MPHRLVLPSGVRWSNTSNPEISSRRATVFPASPSRPDQLVTPLWSNPRSQGNRTVRPGPRGELSGGGVRGVGVDEHGAGIFLAFARETVAASTIYDTDDARGAEPHRDEATDSEDLDDAAEIAGTDKDGQNDGRCSKHDGKRAEDDRRWPHALTLPYRLPWPSSGLPLRGPQPQGADGRRARRLSPGRHTVCRLSGTGRNTAGSRPRAKVKPKPASTGLGLVCSPSEELRMQ